MPPKGQGKALGVKSKDVIVAVSGTQLAKGEDAVPALKKVRSFVSVGVFE